MKRTGRTKSSQIIDLAKQGYDFGIIAERVGVSCHHVGTTVSAARLAGQAIPRYRAANGQTARAVALARQGQTRDEIAEAIGSPNRNAVASLLSKARREGQDVPRITAGYAIRRNAWLRHQKSSKRTGLE